MTKSVAIIGAGAAGLCAARHMYGAGFAITIFEIGSQVGGMWVYKNDNNRSSAYKTLHINTAKHLTSFDDFEFNEDVPPFPNHRDMARYLSDYADHHNIRQFIRFNTQVVDIRPASGYTAQAPSWIVETAAGETLTFDTVIVATGHLTKPMEVEDFVQNFGPGYQHSHHYKDPADFAGKRVCVVGVGNSALDIASDICTTAERTVLVARSQPLIIPKLVFGRPFWDVIKPFYHPWVPGWLRNRALKFLVWVVHGSMDRLGFGPSHKKVHATSNATIVNHIDYRRVIVKKGAKVVGEGRLEFTDSSVETFDAMIAATGYEIELDFLKPEIIENNGYSLDLYMRIVPPQWRGLYLLAFFNSDTALNWICENQVNWILEHETGRAALPSEAEMRGEIAQRQAWVNTHFKDTPRHGIEVEHLPYFRDLRTSLKAAHDRARGTAGVR